LSPSPAPMIDPRTAADVQQQLVELLRLYAPAWNEVDPVTGEPVGVSAALIGVAARLAEILIQRLNEVPQKNFLAFLDLLGAALLPPQPARVPLTFMLAKGSPVDAVVPAGTQVAAPPAPGDKDPVIYETESELVVTAAQLTAAIVRDPENDTYADYSAELLTAGSAGTPVFHGNRRMSHVLYVGHSELLALPGISRLDLIVELQAPAGDDLVLRWEIWNGQAWQDVTPSDAASAAVRNLHQSGTIAFAQVPPARPLAVAGVSKGWIRCGLATPVTRSTTRRSGMVRASQLPLLRAIGLRVLLHQEGLLIDQAYSSAVGLIDLSKDFYPFGEKPRFNDTLWLALDEAFSNSGAAVTLDIKVSNPPGSGLATPPPAVPSEDLRLRWEVWNGSWIELGTSGPAGPVATTVNSNPFSDTTKGLTVDGTVVFTLPAHVASFTVNGHASFWIRVRIVAGNYGVEGHYETVQGAASGFVFRLPNFQPPSIRSLTVTYDLDRPAEGNPPLLPETVIAENDAVFTDLTDLNTSHATSFAPFQPSPDLRPTLYLGFVLPAGRTGFPNEPLAMFFRGADRRYGEKTIPLAPDVSRAAADPGQSVTHRFTITNPGASAVTYALDVFGTQWSPAVTAVNSDGTPRATSPASIDVPANGWIELHVQVTVPPGTAFGASDAGIVQLASPERILYSAQFVTFAHEEESEVPQVRLAWEYWSGRSWTGLAVRDETAGFTTTGTIELLPLSDFASHLAFGIDAFWLRVRWDSGDYDADPRIERIVLNTTMATQRVTVRDEILGSSDGTAEQIFSTTRTPVLDGQVLAVREPEMPSGDELKAIVDDEGADAVRVVADSAGRPSEIWVTWHEVPDFYASDSRSRHYVLDHVTGSTRFGDGLSGMIPPAGSANVRLATYQTGGGVRGNRPAGSIVQLKTTVPYVDKVTNPIDATGGVDAESMGSLLARAPLEIRHRHRAVAPEDYQDLVNLASPDVARVLCISNRDLVADPYDRLPPVLGHVSLIIVPNARETRPQPSIELVRRIQKFISAACPVTATVHVLGPLYLRVDVQAEIGLASLEGAGTVGAAVQDALAAFLHPLTGGFDGAGWEFGREPHRSDIFRVIEEIAEVDHIRALTVETSEEFPGSRETGRFLVYSGTHSIELVFEP